VVTDRRARILTLLAAGDRHSPSTRRLAEVAATVTSLTGAGIMLMSGEIHRGPVAVSDDVAGVIEQLQYTLGEGPCLDAYREDRPVLEADLAEPALIRWTAFAPPAVAAGAQAVFGFPLRIGSTRLGALNLYRDRPGPLSDDQYAYALVAADIVCRALLAMQSGARAGAISADLAQDADFAYVVHQAAGMVSVQLAVTVTEALVRLRAHAFATDRPLTEVGAAVVTRTLRFDYDPPG
jgi:hypothetical protein